MDSSAQKTSLQSLWKDFFTLKPNHRHWTIPFLAAACTGIPLFVGLATDTLSSALTVSFAGLVILYMPVASNFVNRMATLLICSFGFIVCFGIGLTFSFNPIVSCIAFGLLSAVVHWISLLFRLKPPGNFFFLMLASLASSMPFNLEQIPEKIGLVAMGTILACFLALMFSLMKKKSILTQELQASTPLLPMPTYTDYVEAFIIGFFMFAAMLVGYLFALEKPYWIPISCLAVMQGATTYRIWERGIQRIAGTIVGLGLCWLILSQIQDPVGICVAIVLLQFIVESLITRHYGLAVIFITPMTILLAETSAANLDANTLIVTRFWDILIGSLIGAIGGWFVHNEKLRYQAVKSIRMTQLTLKRKN